MLPRHGPGRLVPRRQVKRSGQPSLLEHSNPVGPSSPQQHSLVQFHNRRLNLIDRSSLQQRSLIRPRKQMPHAPFRNLRLNLIDQSSLRRRNLVPHRRRMLRARLRNRWLNLIDQSSLQRRNLLPHRKRMLRARLRNRRLNLIDQSSLQRRNLVPHRRRMLRARLRNRRLNLIDQSGLRRRNLLPHRKRMLHARLRNHAKNPASLVLPIKRRMRRSKEARVMRRAYCRRKQAFRSHQSCPTFIQSLENHRGRRCRQLLI